MENASDDFPGKEARKSPAKPRRKFATNFAENFANFTLEIAGADEIRRRNREESRDFGALSSGKPACKWARAPVSRRG